jgi:hypothetical protein
VGRGDPRSLFTPLLGGPRSLQSWGADLAGFAGPSVCSEVTGPSAHSEQGDTIEGDESIVVDGESLHTLRQMTKKKSNKSQVFVILRLM